MKNALFFLHPPTNWLVDWLTSARRHSRSVFEREKTFAHYTKQCSWYLLSIVSDPDFTHTSILLRIHSRLLAATRCFICVVDKNHQKEENAPNFVPQEPVSILLALIRRSGILPVMGATGEFTSTVICTTFSRQMNKRKKKLFSNSEIFPKSLHLQNFLLQQSPRYAVHLVHYRAAIIQQPSPG